MKTLLIVVVVLASLVIGCTTAVENNSNIAETPEIDPQVNSDQETNVVVATENTAGPLWMSAQLKDVNTDTLFSITDFEGTPVLIESFAVWCPTCTRQQQESKKLEEATDGNIISVALNTDPNEDEEKVRQHTQKHGFEWHYAVASKEVSSSLTEEFGISIVNAPLAPMILVCPDQTTHRLRNGVKSAEELEGFVTSLC